MDGMIEPIRQIVEEASSLEEVRDRLLDALSRHGRLGLRCLDAARPGGR